MIYLHPALASFPAVLLLVALGLEVASAIRGTDVFRVAIRIQLSLAVVFVLAAFFSGYLANDLANQTFSVADSFISRHHLSGRLLAFLILPCAALEFIARRAVYARGGFRVAYLMLLLLCVGLAVYTGHLGGELVFEHGAGVSAVLVPK